MRKVFSIGQFASAVGLTIKALRAYERRGIVHPAVVDVHPGFRSSTQDQFAIAKQIRLLRAVDMPLSEIRAYVQTTDPAAARLLLARQQRRIEERRIADHRALSLLQELQADQHISRKEPAMTPEHQDYRCSFCSKEQDAVRRMIAGPNGVFICDECITTCNEILAEEARTPSSA